MRFVNIGKIVRKYLVEHLFYVLLGTFVFFCLLLYKNTIGNYGFNIFPWVGSLVLISLVPTFRGRVELRELYSIIVLGLFVIFMNMTFRLEFWVEDSLFNFFGMMYFLFFYTRIANVPIEDKVQRGYIYFINYFLFFDLLLLNIDPLLGAFFKSSLDLHIIYIDVGIDILILFLSFITIMTFVVAKISPRSEWSLFSFESNTSLDNKEVRKDYSLDRYETEFTEEEKLIADKICDFFERDQSYLDNEFSLTKLCELILEDNRSTVSRVINEYLGTTFYKLVGQYRVSYALKLLSGKENWTLDVVANSCGFKSVNTFKKHFVEFVGLTPTEYRMNS